MTGTVDGTVCLYWYLPHPSVEVESGLWYLQRQAKEPGLFLHSNVALGQALSVSHSSISATQTNRAACGGVGRSVSSSR